MREGARIRAVPAFGS